MIKFGYTIYPEPSAGWEYETWCESEDVALRRAKELLTAENWSRFGFERVRITRAVLNIEDHVCTVYPSEGTDCRVDWTAA